MAKNKKELTFEQSLQRLGEIVAELEGGALSLDESLARYEEGRRTIGRCYEMLETAERRIEALIAGEDGKLEAKPFEAPDDKPREETPS